MAKQYELSDDSVVVIIGSGAGGGSLGHELCSRGIDVVMLEAGARQSTDTYVNDEWASFVQLAWLEPRTTGGDWRI
ncbi:MAG: FAD-dependent monooxygenase, partial [Alphaproteobacteria bacterium]|nr:FAD-dependent monooxygenase [Alphaproteobacteria bacterium]